jgi:hypothetical protein
MENGGNEQKKHLIQVLVEKVLVYDKDRYEFCFRLPDGEIIAQPIKDARNDEANPLSVSQLAEQVCNHIQDAPRVCLITSRQRSEATFTMNLIKNRKTREYEFQRNIIKIYLLISQKKSSQEMGVITNDASHFLCPELSMWLPAQRYPITLIEKRTRRTELKCVWKQGLESGIYQNRADIARQNNCSRTWVTKVMNSPSE